MKRLHNITRVIIAVTLSISCCERSYFMDTEFEQPKIVMNGILNPSDGLWLNLSKSVPVNQEESTSYIPIILADIQYFENDYLITGLSNSTDGNYFFTDLKPSPGNSYRVVVDAPGFPETEANVVIPWPVDILNYNLDSRWELIDPDNMIYSKYFSVDIEFEDPPEVSNYYMLEAYFIEYDQKRYLEIYSQDQDINSYIQDGLGILAWTDSNYPDEGSINVNFNFDMVMGEGSEIRFYVNLVSIEKAYYDYLNTYTKNFTILNETALISEVIQVHSNVIGGYGILVGYSYDTLWFDYIF